MKVEKGNRNSYMGIALKSPSNSKVGYDKFELPLREIYINWWEDDIVGVQTHGYVKLLMNLKA